MKRILSSISATVLIVGLGCRRHEPRQAMIDVPAMRGPECANIVLQALYRVPGLDHENIETDLARRRAVVTYDSMIVALKNIEYAIAYAGFQANDIPGDPEAAARLPEACRETPESSLGSKSDSAVNMPLALDHDESAD